MTETETIERLAAAIEGPVRDFVARKVAEAVAAFEKRLEEETSGLRAQIAAIPAGAKGDTGERGEKGDAGAPGPAGEPGRDGTNGKDGPPGLNGIPGVDGSDGRDGRDGEPGKDGKDGRDGADGFGFDDMSAELADDDRTIVLRFVRGERTKEFRLELPTPVERGVFKDGAYRRGDLVTSGGNYFIARRHVEPGERPGASEAWRLVVKEGRPGRDLRTPEPAQPREPVRLR